MKIKCPNCGRILGDTTRSVDCNFNCRGCHKTVRIKVNMAESYEDVLRNRKEKND